MNDLNEFTGCADKLGGALRPMVLGLLSSQSGVSAELAGRQHSTRLAHQFKAGGRTSDTGSSSIFDGEYLISASDLESGPFLFSTLPTFDNLSVASLRDAAAQYRYYAALPGKARIRHLDAYA